MLMGQVGCAVISDNHSNVIPGGTLILSYIHKLGSFFGFNIFNFNVILGFQKNKYFWGMKIFWILLGVITK